MSSSRDQISLTGVPGIWRAIATAWPSQSCWPRRPKPPPRLSLWTSHFAVGSPDASAVAASAASPFWVGAQTSQRSGVQRAVAFITSIVAWFWYGYEYTASTLRTAAPSAWRASPAVLPTIASGASRPAFNVAAMVALETAALGPRSHSIGSAASAVFARHQVSA